MSHSRAIRPRSPCGAALALLACIFAAVPAAARAEPDAKAAAEPEPEAPPDPADRAGAIGVLEVATYGVSQAAGEKFEQSVEETLAAVGVRVVRSKQVQKELAGSNYVSGCTFGPCMKQVAARTKLRRVLVARIQGAGQTYSVVVSLVDTESGQPVSQVAQSCPVCTVEDAISTSIKAVSKLFTDEEASRAADVASQSPTAPEPPGDARAPTDESVRLEQRGRQARRLGWILVAAGAVAAGAAVGLAVTDNGDGALAAGGVGGGLVAGGVTCLVWSGSF